MNDQIEMRFAARPAPDVGVAELEGYLKGKGWQTAAEIEAATCWCDRTVRELASESDYIISSPGRAGYKYLGDATAEEYERYRNARRSQARKMVGKVIRTDRIFYRRTSVAGL